MTMGRGLVTMGELSTQHERPKPMTTSLEIYKKYLKARRLSETLFELSIRTACARPEIDEYDVQRVKTAFEEIKDLPAFIEELTT